MTPQPRQLELELMREALILAARGRGYVEPNPMVGCVILKAGHVIGRGHHQKFGELHAEPNAMASCTEDPRGATAIVTLEPCCHTDKKTPPCVPSLIRAGIARVVIGHTDPNPQVSGNGIAQLRAAGIEVISDVMNAQCRQLNAPFFALTQFARPYVTLKWAQSADGLMGGAGNTPRQISGSESNRFMHMLRTRCDAIAVSADTVIADDPMLTPRRVPIIRTPLRVILDAHLRTPPTAKLIQSADASPVHIFTTVGNPPNWPGVTFHQTPTADGHLDLRSVLRELGTMKITHLLIEPGPRLAKAFMQQNLADRIWVIRSPVPLHETKAPAAPDVPYPAALCRDLGIDTLSEYLNPGSEVFFANAASPESQL